MNQPKDYYRILGVPENAENDVIRRAFRRLAFRHHPDRNQGIETEAAERFKELNEAYCILSDDQKRREYDLFRRTGFAGAGHTPGQSPFNYTQDEIFRNFFTNQVSYQDLSRIFAQAGLRFNQDFLNRTFFSGRGFIIQFGPGSFSGSFGQSPQTTQEGYPRKPGLMERAASGLAGIIGKMVMGKLYSTSPLSACGGQNLRYDLTITGHDALSGIERRITYRRGKKQKQLMVKIPAGIVDGTRIRLKGMGQDGNPPGDLYIHVKVK